MKCIDFQIGTRLILGRRRYVVNDEGRTTRVLMDLDTGDLRLLSLTQLRTAQLVGEIAFPHEVATKPTDETVSVRATLVQLRALNGACPAGFVVVRRKDLSELVRGLPIHARAQRQSGLWASGSEFGTRRMRATRSMVCNDSQAPWYPLREGPKGSPRSNHIGEPIIYGEGS